MPDPISYPWKLLRAGPLKLDGGGMFGVIPRVVWSKLLPPDEVNRVTLSHNCLLLDAPDGSNILIESGTGDKLDAKMRNIFGLTDRTIREAVSEVSSVEKVRHVIVSHLHFDHAGGLTRRARDGERADWTDPSTGLGVVRTFGDAEIVVQRREWQDALANNSVMTRTYYRDHLEPIRQQVRTVDSPLPFAPAESPSRAQPPETPLSERLTEVLPGISVFLVPGHTWGQQAVLFSDDRGRRIVFTPDLMPTVHHVGAAYSLSYDVEPYTSMLTRRWFLQEAANNDWLLALDHEPSNPLQRVRRDDRGWYKLIAEP
jgi:glyoxylase-like metal-dependent hydrolase (beta-lactamase superfamily II)